jgi:hypothetical protein
MKRKYEEIETSSKKPKITIDKKRERDVYIIKDNQSAEGDDEEEVVEILKKGIKQKIKFQYSFVKIDKTKVPTYIL